MGRVIFDSVFEIGIQVVFIAARAFCLYYLTHNLVTIFLLPQVKNITQDPKGVEKSIKLVSGFVVLFTLLMGWLGVPW